MSKSSLIILLLFSFCFTANATTVTYSNGEHYSGEILFQNIGAFYVNKGVLNLNGVDVPNGTKTFIPFTQRSFTYLSEFNDGEDIVLPTHDVSTRDFALYNVEVELPNHGYEIFFHNSNTSKKTKQSLVVPYLNKYGSGYMIVRKQDNFSVIDFDIPENSKTVVRLIITEAVPSVTAHFYLNIFNEYVKLENPNIVFTQSGIMVTDRVSGYSETFDVNRSMFASNYYQNITYDLNLDTGETKQNLSELSVKADSLKNKFSDISITMSSTLKLTDLTSKIEEKNKLSDNSVEAIEKTKQGGKGTLYYGLWFIIILIFIGLLWYFDDWIKGMLFKTGKFKDDLVESNVKKQFFGILDYTHNDSFIEIILKLRKLPSNKLNSESVESVIDQLKNISEKIANNLKLKGDLVSKKTLIESKLSEAKELAEKNDLEVRFSTVDFAYTIESCETAISLLDSKLSTIDSLNQKYADKFSEFCKYLSKFLLDAEMDQISNSINFDEFLEDDTDKSAVRDLFNLETLEENLRYLQNYDEALKEVISPLEQQQISKVK